MGLFTINFELGDKTLQTLTRLANNTVIRFELGPETRSMIERLATPDEDDDDTGVGELVKKGAKAIR
jgi:hypothetical protein